MNWILFEYFISVWAQLWLQKFKLEKTKVSGLHQALLLCLSACWCLLPIYQVFSTHWLSKTFIALFLWPFPAVGFWCKAHTHLLSHGTWFLLSDFLWEVSLHCTKKSLFGFFFIFVFKISLNVLPCTDLKNWKGGLFQYQILIILFFILHITR